MKKVTLAARFIVYWDITYSLGEAERHIETSFPSIYTAAIFSRWNTSINDAWAESFFRSYKDERGIDLLWILATLSEVR